MCIYVRVKQEKFKSSRVYLIKTESVNCSLCVIWINRSFSMDWIESVYQIERESTEGFCTHCFIH